MTTLEGSTAIELYSHQKKAVAEMHDGCILCGGVGTGKSRTSLAYYQKELARRLQHSASSSLPLYIITTARKRDTQDWEQEAEPFGLVPIVDSWNNIKKYVEVKNAFFIFDEQRVVGYGAWVKAFLKITRWNRWILLTATPGDTWMDYVPVFIANGYYRNKTDFTRQHVIYSRFSKYPKIDRYVNTGLLLKHRRDIMVNMEYKKKTVPHDETVWVGFDKKTLQLIFSHRWDPYKMEPIQDAGGLCYVMRKAVNSDVRRIEKTRELAEKHGRVIVFYNFDYELELLRGMAQAMDIPCAEWNGHRHELIPDAKHWVYLVQYTAGAEGWNCTETDTLIFYSQNYSYKVMIQAAGRIDRLNTPFTDLYFYHLCSRSGIDLAIQRALKQKKNFNESLYISSF